MTEPVDDPQPWERQKGDGNQAWAAFVIYRDMGPTRSLRAVCSDMGKDIGQMGRWSSRHNWKARVTAFDREQDRIARMVMIDKAIRMGERHADEAIELAKDLMVYPRALLAKLDKDPTAIEKLEEEEVGDLMAMVIACSKVLPAIWQAERVARGYSNETPPLPTADDPDMKRDNPEDWKARVNGVAEVLEEAGKLPPGFAALLRDGGEPA